MQMIERLEEAIESNAGVAEIVVDGQKVRYDRKQMLDELAYWRRVDARRLNRRPVAGSLRLDNSW